MLAMNTGCEHKATKNRMQWSAGPFCAAVVAALLISPALFAGGCAFIEAPEPDPAPTRVPEVFKNPNEFQSTTAETKDPGTPLNDPTGADKTKPAFYRLTQVQSGDLMILQGIWLNGNTEFIPPFAKPIPVKLAGVFSPAPRQPGWREAADATSTWLSGRRLNVLQDKKFPITTDGRKVVVITFQGTGKFKEQEMLFNQLLVRSGYAYVYLTSISSFDYRQWIKDEEYARGKRVELDADDKKRAIAAAKPGTTPTPVPPAVPVGLWAKGIRPPFRQAAPGRPSIAIGPEGAALPTPPPDGAAGGTGGGSGAPSGSSSAPPSSGSGNSASPPSGSSQNTASPPSSGSGNSASP
jgi:endonuclease YncB( thermonuclease family)